MRYPNLFKPIDAQPADLAQSHRQHRARRGVRGAEAACRATAYIRYYEEKAKGGVGLAICGGSSPCRSTARKAGGSRSILSTDKVIDPLTRLADTMHKHGAKIMIQATHMGRRSSFHGEHWPHLMSPSGVREPVHRGNAKIIEIEKSAASSAISRRPPSACRPPAWTASKSRPPTST